MTSSQPRPNPDSAAGPRSYLGSLADQLSGWLYGLPPETTSFTITPLRIPVSEQHFASPTTTKTIELASILYTPVFPQRHQGSTFNTTSTTPGSTSHFGTILVRSPYGLDYPLAVGHARIYAARGYQVLLSACRGTAGSTGEFTPAMDDVADGSATVLWMRRQSWYRTNSAGGGDGGNGDSDTEEEGREGGGTGGTGKWAMLGGSYLTFAQWATVSGLLHRTTLHNTDGIGNSDGKNKEEREEAAQALRELKAMIVLVGPHDWHSYIFGPAHPLIPPPPVVVPGPKTFNLSGGGTLNPDMLSWIGAMIAMEKKQTWLPPPFHMQWHRERLSRELKTPGRSLDDSMMAYFGGEELPGWFRRALRGEMEIPDLSKAVEGLAELRGGTKVLIVAGWGDVFTSQGLEEFGILQGKGNVVGLTLGPWTHLGAQGGQSRVEILQWLDEHMAPAGMGVVKASKGIGKRKHLVRVFDTGKKDWLEVGEWPLENQTVATRKLFLRAEGKFSTTELATDVVESTSFDYDPNDPTPTIGAAMLSNPDGKMQDDGSLANRGDVVSFTTEPFEVDFVIRGSPVIRVYHSSTHPFADLSVRISDVQPSGSSRNISEGYLRLNKIPRDQESGIQPIKITLGECAHTFTKGTKLRLVVAGGSHPKWVRNLGTGEGMITGVETRGVRHTIWHALGKRSVLTLPVLQ